MRTIAVVTGARSDYGILRPVLQAITADAALQPRLMITGSHLARQFGHTVDEIAGDGFDTSERVEMLIAGDSPAAIATSMGVATIGFAERFAARRPDLLLLTGDRFEMFAAAVAALPFAFPIAHLHGGEVSEGAVDEQVRHALTKMSHLHFASTPLAAERLQRLGEAPWRITVSGAPALDNLNTIAWMDRDSLEQRLRISLSPAPIVVTYHPVTLDVAGAVPQVDAVLDAVAAAGRPIVITYPNADTANGGIAARLEEFVSRRGDAVLVASLGTSAYFSLLRIAAAMVGNSSSGILEAPSFELPVVNVGERQVGRDRAANVIDVEPERAAIAAALARALSPAFREQLRGLQNPYGDGQAARRIVNVLRTVALDRALLRKRFEAAATAR